MARCIPVGVWPETRPQWPEPLCRRARPCATVATRGRVAAPARSTQEPFHA